MNKLRARLCRLAFEAAGTDTPLPVETVEGLRLAQLTDANPRALRTLRRATWVLDALRDAGVTGTVDIQYFTSRLIMSPANLEVIVNAPGASRALHVFAESTLRGHPRGMRAGDAYVAVTQLHGRSGDLHHGSGWVSLNSGPRTARSHLVWGTASALAGSVWREVASAAGVAQEFSLVRADWDPSSDSLLLMFTSSAGDLLTHVTADGATSRWAQYTGNRWHSGTGAFGRYLRDEIRTALGTDTEREVFGPFMTELLTQAREVAGLTLTAQTQ